LDVDPLSKAGLLAATRWLDELGKRSLASAGNVLRAAPQYRGLTPTQYRVGFEWLVAVGVVSVDGEVLVGVEDAASVVLEHHLRLHPPTWFAEAGELVTSERDLPIDLVDLASELGVGDQDAFRTLTRAWIKFDDERRREVGLLGELAFVDWVQARYPGPLVHVSQFDDSAGFDVAIGDVQRANVEVKTTLKLGEPTIYLSRNEYRVMLSDPFWCLQLVRLSPTDETLVSVEWIRVEDLASWAPQDTFRGQWQSFKVRVPLSALQQGMSPRLVSATS
jgi:hypothetical protein